MRYAAEPAQRLQLTPVCIGFRGAPLVGSLGKAGRRYPRGESRPKFRKAAFSLPPLFALLLLDFAPDD